ncbi:MAG TPA: methionyl-tRNA formyltransferase [Aggregatilineales bacterium]|nr:methionyl-tRNA formyltransferase [Aggregatilineales bacterium]
MTTTSRIVFMGSPDFAVPTLQALIGADDFEVVGVVTQPDRPAGRGGKIKEQPVKREAIHHRIEVYQPEKLRGEESEARLRAWNPDFQVVAAYGQILRQSILDIPTHGSINVHASLLPRWRGAAPINAAIRAGDSESGITIMKMDAGLDTGPIILQESIHLHQHETAQSLHDKLAMMSGYLLLEALRGILKGELMPRPQDESLVTYAPQIKKEEGEINWTQSAVEIDRHVRAFMPAPSTFTHFNGKLLKIISGEVPAASGGNLAPGEAAAGTGKNPLVIGTGAGLYAPHVLQLEGKKRLDARDFLNGNTDIIGARLGQ